MSHDPAAHEVINELFVSEERSELEHFDSGKHKKTNFVGYQEDDDVFTKSVGRVSNLSGLELEMHEVRDNSVPDMWSWEYCGLYSQYAAVGLMYGTGGALIPLCVYSYDGPTNVCSNARNIVFFAWNLKVYVLFEL